MKLIKFFILIFLLIVIELSGQSNNFKKHTQMNLDCKKCHNCDTPTKANPCLVLCPRNKIDIVQHLPEEGPGDIVINAIEDSTDLYEPVNFSHRLHSEMSLMSHGCSICHHFNPPGKIVKCTTCHSIKRDRTELNIPDIKAAYHRQCLECHKTWEEKTECKNCHELNSNNINKTEHKPSMEKVHTNVTLPSKIVYETESEEGNIVTYFHNDHINLFGLKCTDCHIDENCSNCHAKTKPDFAKADEHDRCSSCHDTEDNCNQCHKNKIAEPFSHSIKTGFSLTKFHENLKCISCHKVENSFTGLRKDCTSCHKNEEGYFKHSITGVLLDETHSDFACNDCHQNNNYSRQPTCDDCHDDISFPDDLPGERIK